MPQDISIRQANTPFNIVKQLTYSLSTIADPVTRSNYSYYSSRQLLPPTSDNFITEYLTMLQPRYMSNVKYEQAIKSLSNQLYTKILKEFIDICTREVPLIEDIDTDSDPFTLGNYTTKLWPGDKVSVISNNYVDIPGCYITHLNNSDIEMPFILVTNIPARRRTITLSYSQQEIADTEEPHMLLISSILTFELNFLTHPNHYKRILCSPTKST